MAQYHFEALFVALFQAIFVALFEALFEANFEALLEANFEALFEANFEALFEANFEALFEAHFEDYFLVQYHFEVKFWCDYFVLPLGCSMILPENRMSTKFSIQQSLFFSSMAFL